MAIASINEQLLKAVGVGIALFDARLEKMQFCNDVFPKMEEFVLEPRCLLLIVVVMSESRSCVTTIHYEQKKIYNFN